MRKPLCSVARIGKHCNGKAWMGTPLRPASPLELLLELPRNPFIPLRFVRARDGEEGRGDGGKNRWWTSSCCRSSERNPIRTLGWASWSPTICTYSIYYLTNGVSHRHRWMGGEVGGTTTKNITTWYRHC